MGTTTRRKTRRRKGLGTWRLVRYADDFVVMVAGTEANAESLRDRVADTLAPMGLRLNDAKTRVVHIDEGFDFLGFRIQRKRRRGSYLDNRRWPVPQRDLLMPIAVALD
jgi:RNA-directed DNA polymerase